MNPEQKRRAEQFTSLFENDRLELQYDYVEAIDDGRGFTCGRAGFTTASGDARLVIERYTDKYKEDNALARFVPELRNLERDNSGDTTNLVGYRDAWKTAALDKDFRASQDQIVDEEYYQPSVEHSEELGLQTALAQAVLYDSIIQHGDGKDPDGLPKMLDRAQAKAGGTPRTTPTVDEKEWLTAFLDVRHEVLSNPSNPATKKEWEKSKDRVDAFRAIAAVPTYDLNGPIEINTKNHKATIP